MRRLSRAWKGYSCCETVSCIQRPDGSGATSTQLIVSGTTSIMSIRTIFAIFFGALLAYLNRTRPTGRQAPIGRKNRRKSESKLSLYTIAFSSAGDEHDPTAKLSESWEIGVSAVFRVKRALTPISPWTITKE